MSIITKGHYTRVADPININDNDYYYRVINIQVPLKLTLTICKQRKTKLFTQNGDQCFCDRTVFNLAISLYMIGRVFSRRWLGAKTLVMVMQQAPVLSLKLHRFCTQHHFTRSFTGEVAVYNPIGNLKFNSLFIVHTL
jgi:hypothetical protein